MKNFYLASLILVALSCTWSLKAQAFDHNHQTLNELLGAIVVMDGHQSRVKYAMLIQRRAELEVYLDGVSSVTRASFDEFDPQQQLAFLINAYNGFQLLQVIDHYPLKSIKDVGSFFSSPWSKKFFTLLGEETSLDKIEHELIRPVFNEPRIHFAVNCASISCPPLMKDAYVASKLDVQLENAAFNFLQDRDANYRKGDTLYLSKIFDWYEEDFGTSVVEFVAPYMGYPVGDLKVEHTDYNWNLNVFKPGGGAQIP